MPDSSLRPNPTASFWRPFHQAAHPAPLPKIQRGEGLTLFGDQGTQYLDGISGSYNHCFGHSDPGLRQALVDQLDQLVHFCSVTADTALPEALARRLVEAVDLPSLNHVFLTLSGSEGIEAALKMAWLFHFNHAAPRAKIASLEGAYHGCTMGALLATQRQFSTHGLPFVSGADSIALPPPHRGGDLDLWAALLEREGEQIAAIVIEPVMGLEGAIQHPEGFLRDLCELARHHQVITICDEVFCGIGRAGAISQARAQGASPDIVVFSKCLGAGIPITATVASDRVFDAFLGDSMDQALRTGHTQTGNLLGCAAAVYTLDRIVAEGWCAKVLAKGERLLAALTHAVAGHPDVQAVRGTGLMLAVECATFEACAQIQARARKAGLLLGSAGACLKISPAFIISDAESDRLVDLLAASLP